MIRRGPSARSMGNLPFQDIGKDCRAGFCGPLTLEAQLSQPEKARHRKSETSLKKWEESTQTQPQNTHPLHHLVFVIFMQKHEILKRQNPSKGKVRNGSGQIPKLPILISFLTLPKRRLWESTSGSSQRTLTTQRGAQEGP